MLNDLNERKPLSISRFWIHGAAIVAGGAIGLFVLTALGTYLADLTGSPLLADAIVLGPLITAAAVLGWQVYGPTKKAEAE